jgi:Tfp pilus assembly protein PilF
LKAQVLANSGEMRRAEQMLFSVLHHNPYHTEALHLLANVLGQKGKHEEVMNYFYT